MANPTRAAQSLTLEKLLRMPEPDFKSSVPGDST
jgi:hypothetical protein